MTSGNLYFKLLKEDFKRRTWAIALTFLGFFFTLPVGLALTMENAANTNYFVYNGYKDFIMDGTVPDALFRSDLLALKTKVVLGQVSFGNWLIVCLLIGAAVVIGVSGFSYLHHKRQVDFYHSIPVRREVLYSVQYTGGILMVGLSYLINLALTMGVALSYGVHPGSIIRAMAGSWALNMLFFLLMYGVVVVAMMMTGNLVVGILASGVFFFFIPAVMFLLSVYCETFFLTSSRGIWGSSGSPFIWGMKSLSPFSVYMTALDWGTEHIGRHIPELICACFAFLALFILGLQLYRKRPSEAAGRAMAFKRTMMPIRVLLVLGCGLGGGMLFWALQSQLKWGLFGVAVSVILAHCVVEIIYHFDFKKLFGHKIQLAVSLAACILIFLSFCFDWYGYDSYLPKAGEVASASLEIGADSSWMSHQVLSVGDNGVIKTEYKEPYEDIEKNMKLTDMSLVMPFVEEGRRNAQEDRRERLTFRKNAAYIVSSIGDTDGPTSIFVAGKDGEGDSDMSHQRFPTNVTVAYELKNGRQVRRSYHLFLSDVMGAYEKLYDQKDYKMGLYSILSQAPGELERASYKEAGTTVLTTDKNGVIGELLKAYQSDLADLDIQQRTKEGPIGSITFITKASDSQLMQDMDKYQYNQRGGFWDYNIEDFTQDWPVYPSFTRTLKILQTMGVKPGTAFLPENVKEVSINARSLMYSKYGRNNNGDLPKGEELAELQKKNPYYRQDGTLEFTDPQDIAALMKNIAEQEYYRMDPLCQTGGEALNCDLTMKNNISVSGIIQLDQLTPDTEKLFDGIIIQKSSLK